MALASSGDYDGIADVDNESIGVESLEERVDRLENDFRTSMQQIARSLAEAESEQYEHKALLNAHSKDLREIRLRVATVETRLNGVDEKIDDLKIQQQQMNDKLDTIIDLLTRKEE